MLYQEERVTRSGLSEAFDRFDSEVDLVQVAIFSLGEVTAEAFYSVFQRPLQPLLIEKVAERIWTRVS